MAYKYLGQTAKLYPASISQKKYKIYDPNNEKWINFGQIGYEDFTKHKDKTRRKNYLLFHFLLDPDPDPGKKFRIHMDIAFDLLDIEGFSCRFCFGLIDVILPMLVDSAGHPRHNLR